MDNIWTKINEDVPRYMDLICKKYNMQCVKINPLSTLLFNNNCCFIIQIGRFEIDLIYIFYENGKIHAYQCGNYLALRYDNDDRKGVINNNGADNIVRNNLLIIANGLASKCEDILLGKRDWLEKYRYSSRFLEVRLSNEIIAMLSLKCGFNYED